MAGFGNVGRELCGLLLDKSSELTETYGCNLLLTGVSTRSKGTLVNPEGLDMEKILVMDERFGRFDAQNKDFCSCEVNGMIDTCGADLFMELTTLSIKDGEPATSYIERALNRGMHVITANKGPIAWNFNKLAAAAEAAEREFLYETTVMDGTPLFNMVGETLRGNRINRIRGVLNSTSNFILGRIANGSSYDDALRTAQMKHIAEKDPSLDIDGWDGAAKICALANVLMNAGTTPDMVNVTSSRGVRREDIEEAGRKGLRIKYVCEAIKDETAGTTQMSVRLRRLEPSDVLANVNGTSSAVTLYTDLAGEITIVQSNPEILQTAYGVYSDIITLIRRTAKL